MPTKPLPEKPDLDQLKRQAKELLRAHRDADPAALQRIREFHPRFGRAADPEIVAAPFALADAQLASAGEPGYARWQRLRERTGAPTRADDTRLPAHERIEDPAFRRAVDLADAGDIIALRAHLAGHPQLVRQRVRLDGGNYFREPTLIEFVAENPVRRDRMPANVVDVARTILDAGAPRDAATRALELVASGRVAREAGAQVPLIRLLCERGADPDAAILASMAHGEWQAVDALLAAGARVTLPVAAGLGRAREAEALLSSARGEERHLALALAAQFGRARVVQLLLERGEDPSRYNPPGAHAHSTPLHQAAVAGHEAVVRLLLAYGARTDLRDTIHGGMPLEWATYGKQEAIARILSEARAPIARPARTLRGDLLWRANVARDEGDRDAALALYEEALALAREEGDPLAVAHAERHVADLLPRDRAAPLLAEMLSIYRAHPEASALDVANGLRAMALHLGESEEARALWREAAELYERAGVPAGSDEARRHAAGRP